MIKVSNASKEINNPEVAAVFKSYPKKIRAKLMFLRQLILEIASVTEGVGELEETLKWGEPSYLTPKTKSGSTIRIDWKKTQEEQYAMYFKCTANLVIAFKERYPTEFKYGGNRSIIFKIDDEIPVKELKSCISLALTYHLNKKLETADRWDMVKKSHNKFIKRSVIGRR
ncbi:MAG: DUF1801 domain-containing protein [Deltaproteobacteria bacterium]|nr:DUF1801 domain-containing protein [Deltaproteobacteria bacterium]